MGSVLAGLAVAALRGAGLAAAAGRRGAYGVAAAGGAVCAVAVAASIDAAISAIMCVDCCLISLKFSYQSQSYVLFSLRAPLFGGIFASRWLRFVNPQGRFLSFSQFSAVRAFQPIGRAGMRICRCVLPTCSWARGLAWRSACGRIVGGCGRGSGREHTFWRAGGMVSGGKRYGLAVRKVTSCGGLCCRGVAFCGSAAVAGAVRGCANRVAYRLLRRETRLPRGSRAFSPLGFGLWGEMANFAPRPSASRRFGARVVRTVIHSNKITKTL